MAQIELWEALAHCIDVRRPLVIAGDFNMGTAAIDQVGGGPRNLTKTELEAWSQSQALVGLQEVMQLADAPF
jgi:endonuclease/exonuclease/phosphatase family metal-dependent hydrolase